MFDLFFVETFEEHPEPEVMADSQVDTSDDMHEVALSLTAELGSL